MTAEGGLRPARRVLCAHFGRRLEPPARDARREPRAHRGASDGPPLPATPDLPRRAEEAGPRGLARVDGRRRRGRVSVAYDENVGKVLKTLGQPLELVNLGQTKASLRLDSRYIKDILQRADQDSVAWTPIADPCARLRFPAPAGRPLPLLPLPARPPRVAGRRWGTVDVRIGMSQTTRIRLQRGKLVSAADWHRLRDLGNQLFEESRPAAHRSCRDRTASRRLWRRRARRSVRHSRGSTRASSTSASNRATGSGSCRPRTRVSAPSPRDDRQPQGAGGAARSLAR